MKLSEKVRELDNQYRLFFNTYKELHKIKEYIEMLEEDDDE